MTVVDIVWMRSPRVPGYVDGLDDDGDDRKFFSVDFRFLTGRNCVIVFMVA